MRVVCINDRWVNIAKGCENEYRPKIGDRLTVKVTHKDDMGIYYVFEETTHSTGYMAKYFIPIDEETTDAEFELVDNDTANQK